MHAKSLAKLRAGEVARKRLLNMKPYSYIQTVNREKYDLGTVAHQAYPTRSSQVRLRSIAVILWVWSIAQLPEEDGMSHYKLLGGAIAVAALMTFTSAVQADQNYGPRQNGD